MRSWSAGVAAMVLALTISPALCVPVYLSCHANVGAAPRDWAIQIEGDQASPLGGAYDRIPQSSSPVQYIRSRVTGDLIDIWVRNGNYGEQFSILRDSGMLQFERIADLNHSGTERIVEQGSGTCKLSGGN